LREKEKLVRNMNVKVRYYIGANKIVTFYIPTEEKEKIKVFYDYQQWLEPIVEYTKKYGKHKVERRWGYSSFARMRVLYSNDVWIIEIDACELIRMITSCKSWTRSRHAKEIVEKLKNFCT
jgi:hypothetical protein